MKDNKLHGLALVLTWLVLILVSWVLVGALFYFAVVVFRAIAEVLSS